MILTFRIERLIVLKFFFTLQGQLHHSPSAISVTVVELMVKYGDVGLISGFKENLPITAYVFSDLIANYKEIYLQLCAF